MRARKRRATAAVARRRRLQPGAWHGARRRAPAGVRAQPDRVLHCPWPAPLQPRACLPVSPLAAAGRAAVRPRTGVVPGSTCTSPLLPLATTTTRSSSGQVAGVGAGWLCGTGAPLGSPLGSPPQLRRVGQLPMSWLPAPLLAGSTGSARSWCGRSCWDWTRAASTFPSGGRARACLPACWGRAAGQAVRRGAQALAGGLETLASSAGARPTSSSHLPLLIYLI